MSLSNQAIADFLRAIPQSNQPKSSLINTYKGNATQDNIATLYGIVRMLRVIGMVELEDRNEIGESLIQATSQTSKYALMSLAEYVEQDKTIIPDWKTRGIQDNVLANGATFLQAMEYERIKRFKNSSPSRYVKVAQVLIKRINSQTNEHEFLFQFDANANQYQLIGGRWSENDGDDLKMTIIREIEEELPMNHLLHPDAYQLQCLIDNLVINGTVSTTFGALTHYTFWIYHMTNLKTPLKLQSDDLWVPLQMVLDGNIKVGDKEYPFASPEVFQRIDASITGGLLGLSSSFVLHQADGATDIT